MASLSSCFALPCKFKTLSLHASSPSSSSHSRIAANSLGFSGGLSCDVLLSGGRLSVSHGEKNPPRFSVVCEAAPQKRADSAAKRDRQAEKRRVYNKARKSEIRTRMKKVLEELDGLRKKSDAQAEDILQIEKLIAEAYSVIDKAVKVGTLHRNTGARRKSRLARRKKAVEIHHGWYTPAPAETA
ncbi:30S ribosomal protein S20, chloroplastic [Rhodamnia argentea]|uniref:Small ribosomal subunit protein bS20c n=1 Tax=Rhodamnia argentea TaxID=178133 RepID=A0A8B8MQD0_9MYRT|nr:30S ribosomal protein S20, chloroplastic [Rhodamnia argentea]